ncbi:MAG TPA: hypothetical protein VFQ27_13475 [Xanthobacteraceae bacterium]|nr:hypothetical protein [Xanthobacteraceae bacterium]
MGTVIRFPDERRTGWNAGSTVSSEPGSIIILPVVRIERHIEENTTSLAPGAGAPQGNGRRRRGRRS